VSGASISYLTVDDKAAGGAGQAPPAAFSPARFPPVKHPERAERVPAARLPLATVEGEVDTAGMNPVE
jgi:hypothetical protein